jgi:chemotaxis protein CheC
VYLRDLSELQLDALREVGSIGAGHAATALSQLLDRPLELEAPRIEVVSLTDISTLYGGPERLVAVVYCGILGDVGGAVLFVASDRTARSLVDLMHGRPLESTTELGVDGEKVFRHAASILISAYLAAIARMADLEVLPSHPAFGFDMAGALLEDAIVDVGGGAAEALLVRTSFIDEGQAIEAGLFFIPDPGSLDVILGKLGLA